MKHITKAITGLAAIAILVAGSGNALAVPNLIILILSIAWLSLVGFATFRRRWRHD